MLSYLQWLDADRAGLPDWFRERLARALARYGVDSLERTPALEAAAVWLWRSFRRADKLEPAVTAILQRRLRHRDAQAVPPGPELRDLLTRLATAAQARYPALAELAHDVVFRYLDEPLLEKAVGAVFAEMEEHLDALADPGLPDRAERVARLVWCPQPMRGMLLHRWADGARPARGRARRAPAPLLPHPGSARRAVRRSGPGICWAAPTTTSTTSRCTSSPPTRRWPSWPRSRRRWRATCRRSTPAGSSSWSWSPGGRASSPTATRRRHSCASCLPAARSAGRCTGSTSR